MKAVVFDMDGLMFNTEDVYTLVGKELLRRRGQEFTPELKNEMMGLPPQKSFEIMIRRCDLRDTVAAAGCRIERLFISLLDAHLAPMPGLIELLYALETARIPNGHRHQQFRELARRLSGSVSDAAAF